MRTALHDHPQLHLKCRLPNRISFDVFDQCFCKVETRVGETLLSCTKGLGASRSRFSPRPRAHLIRPCQGRKSIMQASLILCFIMTLLRFSTIMAEIMQAFQPLWLKISATSLWNTRLKKHKLRVATLLWLGFSKLAGLPQRKSSACATIHFQWKLLGPKVIWWCFRNQIAGFITHILIRGL